LRGLDMVEGSCRLTLCLQPLTYRPVQDPGSTSVGIIGGVVGGFLFRLLAIAAGGLIGSIVTATVGAVVLLFLVGLFKKA
jgi:hypothetical protein